MIELLETLKLISNKEIRGLTKFHLEKYLPKIEELPASLSREHHFGETHEKHLQKTSYFALELAREFNLSSLERDVLLSASLLHDIAYYEFVSKKRFNEEYQKRYPTKYNRSREIFNFHPTIAEFLIGKYIIEKRKFLPELFQIARLVGSHMSHWLKEYNPEPQDLLGYLLCVADYFASRRELKIVESK